MVVFKKNRRQNKDLNFVDIDGEVLKVGDKVLSLRYELGKCIIIRTDEGLCYESIESKKIVSWGKMIDAATRNQKVRKL